MMNEEPNPVMPKRLKRRSRKSKELFSYARFVYSFSGAVSVRKRLLAFYTCDSQGDGELSEQGDDWMEKRKTILGPWSRRGR
jgi:hypothetical protein